MIDIQNPLNTYILERLPIKEDAVPIITNDIFLNDTGTALCCVPAPSNVYERKHLDGTILGRRNFDYRCRSENPSEARLILELLLELTDDLHLDIASGVAYDLLQMEMMDFELKTDVSLDCEAVSAPVFLGVDEKQQSVYQCSISVTYNN